MGDVLWNLKPAPVWKHLEKLCSIPRPSKHEQQAAAYVYEFERTPLTNALAHGLGLTRRNRRELQMGRVGSDVPLVRCTNHAPVLNLSFGGRIHESGLEWEDQFSALVPREELSLEHLLSDHVRLQAVRIPAREWGLPREQVDLTGYYNGSLKGWLEWRPEASLADFSAGGVTLAGVDFDARGAPLPFWTNPTLSRHCWTCSAGSPARN